MNLEIPSSIFLFAQEIEIVKTANALYLPSGEPVEGLSDFDSNILSICAPRYRPIETVEGVFLHELFHFIVFYAGDEVLYAKEEYIQGTSLMLHQFIKTAVFDNKEFPLVPSSFSLGGCSISVKNKQDSDGSMASADYMNQNIFLDLEQEIGVDKMEVLFAHQLLLFISFILHDQKFRKARLYRVMAYLLHQAFRQIIILE